jgi:hypothetical protein
MIAARQDFEALDARIFPYKHHPMLRVFKNKLGIVRNTRNMRKFVAGWQSAICEKSSLRPCFVTRGLLSNGMAMEP